MIISPDDIIGARQWTPALASEAWRLTRHIWEAETHSGRFDRAIIMIGLPGSGKSTMARRLDDDRTLILDSTMTVASRRMEYVALSGIPVLYVWFDVNADTCKARQKGRKYPIPFDVIDRMDSQLGNPEWDSGPQKCRRVLPR